MRKQLLRSCIAAFFVAWLPGLLCAGTVTRPVAKVYQAKLATSGPSVRFGGYAGALAEPQVAIPGVLDIVPGSGEYGAGETAPYVIVSTVLEKNTPDLDAPCGDLFPRVHIVQEGVPNIRTHWPLMYEPPGTTWTLTVVYTTDVPYDDDGPGPNPPSLEHTEVWPWVVDVDITSLRAAVVLFGQMPFANSQVPLLSDEDLRRQLMGLLDSAAIAIAASNWQTAIDKLQDFELLVMDSCITSPPMFPAPAGPGTGIANTSENPAGCKLVLDAEALIAYLKTQQSLPPDVSKAVASVPMLWTPNGSMTAITIKGVTDPGGYPVTISITGITQDEPVKGGIYGSLAPDGSGIGTSKAMLRAERYSRGNGRCYRVAFTAMNSKGASSNGFVNVGVPVPDPKVRNGTICVDDGQKYDSTASK